MLHTMDMTIALGLHQFSLHAFIDQHALIHVGIANLRGNVPGIPGARATVNLTYQECIFLPK